MLLLLLVVLSSMIFVLYDMIFKQTLQNNIGYITCINYGRAITILSFLTFLLPILVIITYYLINCL